MSSRRALLESLLLSRLPSAFQEVEWIGSSRTQYIDSQYIGKYGLSTYAKIIYTGGLADNVCLLGARIDSGQTRLYLGYRIYNSHINIGYEQEYQSQTAPSNVLHEYKYELLNSVAKIYQDNMEILSQSITPNFTTNQNMYIFAYSYLGNAASNIACKLYSLKIYDNKVLVRDFVPCYRKADNKIGLYDLVNCVFYTNAGTGRFTKGGNV